MFSPSGGSMLKVVNPNSQSRWIFEFSLQFRYIVLLSLLRSILRYQSGNSVCDRRTVEDGKGFSVALVVLVLVSRSKPQRGLRTRQIIHQIHDARELKKKRKKKKVMKLISERVLSWQNRKFSELVFREKEKI